MFGIYDTQDNLWIGNGSGPFRFGERWVAQIVAQVAEARATGTDMGLRFQVREIPEGECRLRDHIEPKLTAVEALRKIEGEN